MRQTFHDLILYLRQNSDSFYFDDTFDGEALESEILAFAEIVQQQIH